MNRHLTFLRTTLDAQPDHIAVIGRDGAIQFANHAWVRFGENNGSDVRAWSQENYLAECDRAAAAGDPVAEQARQGVRAVLEGRRKLVSMDYPCHSPSEWQWYRMIVTGFADDTTRYGIVVHRNVTDEKWAARRGDADALPEEADA